MYISCHCCGIPIPRPLRPWPCSFCHEAHCPQCTDYFQGHWMCDDCHDNSLPESSDSWLPRSDCDTGVPTMAWRPLERRDIEMALQRFSSGHIGGAKSAWHNGFVIVRFFSIAFFL